MLEAGIAQLRFAASLALGIPFSPRSLDRIIDALLATHDEFGTLDTAAADRTVAELLAGGSDPVITKKPEGAWTDVVTKAAAAMK